MRTPHNERLTPDTSNVVHAGSGDDEGRPAGRQKATPERRCILTGDVAPRDTLVRLAISPDGLVLPDPLAKAPGRGAWLGVSRAELETALAKGKLRGALARAFKGAKLTVPDDLSDLIEAGLKKAVLDRLGLALRGGALVFGSDRIAEHARSGRLAMLLHAADAREDGCRKLDQAWRVGREEEGSGARGMRLPLDRTALSVALGRENVVHLGISGGVAGGAVASLLARLVHYRGADPDPPPDLRAARDKAAAA
ncbi:MAG: DUF448 domain-containing protein [Parerythrobacter sp.]